MQPSKRETLKAINLTNVFFETDDANISIEEIYNAATAILQIDLKALQLQIEKNAKQVFGDCFIKL